jgi:hypothetical protein
VARGKAVVPLCARVRWLLETTERGRPLGTLGNCPQDSQLAERHIQLQSPRNMSSKRTHGWAIAKRNACIILTDSLIKGIVRDKSVDKFTYLDKLKK